MVDDDDRRRKLSLGREGGAVELDDIHLRVLGQSGDAPGGLAQGSTVLGQPVQGEAGIDELEAWNAGRGGTLLLGWRGAHHGDHRGHAEPRQSAGEIEAVLPDAAHGIGGDEDALRH